MVYDIQNLQVIIIAKDHRINLNCEIYIPGNL